MSYIRSGSNPEALYIWGDKEKIVHILKGANKIGTIPTKILNNLINKYIDKYHEDCRHKGAEIREVWVNAEDVVNGEGEKNCKMMLSYGEWNVIMWSVTWDCIATSNY